MPARQEQRDHQPEDDLAEHSQRQRQRLERPGQVLQRLRNGIVAKAPNTCWTRPSTTRRTGTGRQRRLGSEPSGKYSRTSRDGDEQPPAALVQEGDHPAVQRQLAGVGDHHVVVDVPAGQEGRDHAGPDEQGADDSFASG